MTINETVTETPDLTAQLQQVVSRFARGVDRHDADIINACYWPGAYDDHGVYTGDAEGFATWVTGATAHMGFMQHSVSNLHLLGVKSVPGGNDIATSETYYHMRCVGVDGELAQVFGRYLDQWEQRDSAGRQEWRITRRLCTLEWSSPNSGYSADDFTSGANDRTDPSYQLAELVA